MPLGHLLGHSFNSLSSDSDCDGRCYLYSVMRKMRLISSHLAGNRLVLDLTCGTSVLVSEG